MKQLYKVKAECFVCSTPVDGRYKRGERSLYIKPFRLVYVVRGDELILLKFDHRKDVYRE